MLNPIRDELKFIVHHKARTMLLARWERFLSKDIHTNAYAQTPVLSQYYDTPTFDFCEKKVDGVGRRHKLRLRTYGYRFEPGAPVFPEIKQRFNDKIRKIRSRIDSFDPSHLDPHAWTYDGPEEAGAFGSIINRHPLIPSAQVWYLREAYQGVVEADVRVTFDSHLTGLHPREELTRGVLADRTRSLMPDNLMILEIKATYGIPGWVVEGVKCAELRQQPVPKYVIAVEQLGLLGTIPAVGVYS
jgi:hypothetical protein